MALAELHRRRPDTRFVLFGTDRPPRTAFPYEHCDVLSAPQLAAALLRGDRRACACR